jgi:PAS domain S-box-containing protein
MGYLYQKKIKILHLEDMPDHAGLVRREIEKSGIQHEIHVVDNKLDFLTGLCEFLPDIVLTDHSLPDIDSREALHLTKTQANPVPLILITATVSEEYAVEVMKAGAYDYILKDRLQRLPMAIQKAIEKWNIERERKKYFEETIASAQRYKQIVETAQEGIWVINNEFKITFVNQKLCEILEYSSEELLGKAFNDLIEDAAKDSEGHAIKTRMAGVAENFDLRFRTKFGRHLWASVSTSPIMENGKFAGALAMVTDITERKLAEEKLRQERTLLRTLIDHLPDYVFIKDVRSRHLINNKANVEFFGFEREEDSLGKSIADIFPGERSQKLIEDDQEVMRSGVSIIGREEVIATRGKEFCLLTTKIPFRDNRGNIVGLIGISRDITERKRIVEQLAANEKRYRALVENISDGIVLVNTLGNIVYQSPSVERIMGYSESEGEGTLFIDYIHPDYIRGYHRLKENLVQHPGVPLPFVYPFLHRNGNYVWLEGIITNLLHAPHVNAFVVNYRDITERKNIDEALKEFNERYELLSKATNDAIWDWKVTTDFINWNHGLQTIFGYSDDEIRTTWSWWYDRVHPEDRLAVKESIDQAFLERKKNWSFTYRFLAADGNYKYVYDRAYVMYDENFRAVRMTGAMQDISERMRAIEEIEKLSFVASKTDNAVVIMDALQRIEWVNEGFERMTGYTLAEIKGKTNDFLIGQETDQSVLHWINGKIKLGESVSGELLNYTKNGTKFWVKVDVTPVFNDQGRLKNCISIQSDITQRKEFENRITAIARELSSLIENANVPICGIDRNGYINEWNKVFAETSGISKSDILGRNLVKELVSVDQRLDVEQMIAHVLHGTSVSNFELQLNTRANKTITLLLSASPRRDAQQSINGAIMVAQDITELIDYRKNLEKIVQDRTRELNEALQKEKELVNMKSKFVSIASHEFRTPLSTITLASGFLKRFKEKLSPAEIDDKIASIEKQVAHMTHLLDDVLTVGKVESGKIPVRIVEIDIMNFFRQICHEIEQTTGRTHYIRILSHVGVTTFHSDEKLLRNIVINILTNAIKFSPNADHVDVVLKNDSTSVSFGIRDYGIGIPEEDMKELFEPFHRGRNVNAIQGTGLGLSIIKKAVDLLKGFINVKSEVGKGTELTITLPLSHE